MYGCFNQVKIKIFSFLSLVFTSYEQKHLKYKQV